MGLTLAPPPTPPGMGGPILEAVADGDKVILNQTVKSVTVDDSFTINGLKSEIAFHQQRIVELQAKIDAAVSALGLKP